VTKPAANQLRIMMLAQFYPPIVGGEEQHVHSLSRELAARGHAVSVVTQWQPGLADFALEEGVRIHRVRSTAQRMPWLYKEQARRHAPPLPDPELLWQMGWLVAQEHPQIVHAHNWMVHSFLPLSPFVDARLVVTLHDYSLVCAKKRLMVRQAACSGPGLRRCLACAGEHYGTAKGAVTVLGNWMMTSAETKAVDMFVAVSRAVAEGNRLPQAGLPYLVIPNMVPVDWEEAATCSDARLAQLPAGDFFLYVGDLSQDKGIDVLFEAYAALEGAPPLVLIGRRGGDTPGALPPNVVELGTWPHAAVLAAWRRCYAGLVPSVWPEPFGIVALEAMAAGRPLIASRTGGLTDIVEDGSTGVLVEPGDAAALSRAMAQLVADRALCAKMGEAARRRVCEFGSDQVVGRIEQLYYGLLKPRTVASPDGVRAQRMGIR
jgi:glycosyltransferase involved in cell wall biosynthesis